MVGIEQYFNLLKDDIKKTVNESQKFFQNQINLYIEDVKNALTKSEADHEKIHEDNIVMFKSLMQHYQKLDSVTNSVSATLQDLKGKHFEKEEELKVNTDNESVVIDMPEDALLEENGDILWVGDSISDSIDFGVIRNDCRSKIKTVKAYSARFDEESWFPAKNVTDVVAKQLSDPS